MAATMMTLKPCPTRASVRTAASFRTGAPLVACRPVAARRCQRLVTRAVSSAEVLPEVQKIIAEQLGKDEGEVKPESKFVDLGADSLDTVEIMMALEEKFDLQLDEEGAEKIATVQEAAELIAGQTS